MNDDRYTPSLDQHPCDVVAMTTDSADPHIAVGEWANSPWGPRIGLGVSPVATDGLAYAQIAAVPLDVAEELASRILSAVSAVRKSLS